MIHYYRNKTDYIPSHSNDDQYIDANFYILSLSFGQTRNFIIRRKTDNVIRFSAYLYHGDILLMSKGSQELFRDEMQSKKQFLSLEFRKMRVC